MTAARVLLISGNTEDIPAPVYPLGVARLAGAARGAGCEVRQADLLVHGLPGLAKILTEFMPALVGISIRNIDNTDAASPRSYLPGYRAIVDLVRRSTSAPIVLGGSGFSIFPERVMRLLGADYGAAGAGEEAIVSLVDSLDGRRDAYAKGSLIKGAACHARGCPAPALHDPEIVSFYWRRAGMIGIQTKRGCPRQCSYCTYPVIEGRSVHCYDPAWVVGEMERMVVDHGVRYFFMADSTFNIAPDHEAAIAEEIVRRGLRVSWGGFFTPAGLTRDYISTLKRGGLTHVELGSDSLSEDMLVSYRKGFTVGDAVRASEICADAGIYCGHYIMFGGPGETAATVRETIENARGLRRSIMFPFAGVRIYPGTALHDEAVSDGRIAAGHDCLEPVFYMADALSPDGIWEALAAEPSGGARWVLPSEYVAFAPIVEKLRGRGAAGPLWEYLLS